MDAIKRKEKWGNLVEHRYERCKGLKPDVIQTILKTIRADVVTLPKIHISGNAPVDHVKAFLASLYDAAANSKHDPSLRRKSFNVLKKLQRELGQALMKPDNLRKSPTAHMANNANLEKTPQPVRKSPKISASQKQTVPTSTASVTKTPSNAATSNSTIESSTSSSAMNTGKRSSLTADLAKKSVATNVLASSHIFSAESVLTENQNAAKRSSTANSNTTPSSTSTTNQRQKPTNNEAAPSAAAIPPPYEKYSSIAKELQSASVKKRKAQTETNQSGDIALNSTSKKTKTSEKETNSSKTPHNTHAPKPQRQLKSTSITSIRSLDKNTQRRVRQTIVSFKKDAMQSNGYRFSCSKADRPPVKIHFYKEWPSNEMLHGAGQMFKHWEPFWEVNQVVAAGVTSTVNNLNWVQAPKFSNSFLNIPRTVASFRLPPMVGPVFEKIRWGSSETGHAKDGDSALIMRMLPIHSDPKYKRANYHLWPKGTFLAIDSFPVHVTQRKQASHDASKWEGMSHPLLLSRHIHPPMTKSRSIDLCCQDSVPYLYMVAVCKFRSPTSLYQNIVKQISTPDKCDVQVLTHDEAVEKAINSIKQNAMISIDDDEDKKMAGEKEMGRLIFSLVDPVMKIPMTIPVRGRQCKHWQCFDLESFLAVNKPVSGGRWRCLCCELFISFRELEVCGLTRTALKKFKLDASATRDKVEFRVDKSMYLLKESQRAAKKRRKHSASGNSETSTTAQRKASEAIEIIDID